MNVWGLRRLSRIGTAVSSSLESDLVRAGVDRDRIQVIPNAIGGVSAADFSERRQALRTRLGIADDEFVFGYVGRLSAERGPEHLLRAAGQMQNSRRTRLVLLGDGPLRAN